MNITIYYLTNRKFYKASRDFVYIVIILGSLILVLIRESQQLISRYLYPMQSDIFAVNVTLVGTALEHRRELESKDS